MLLAPVGVLRVWCVCVFRSFWPSRGCPWLAAPTRGEGAYRGVPVRETGGESWYVPEALLVPVRGTGRGTRAALRGPAGGGGEVHGGLARNWPARGRRVAAPRAPGRPGVYLPRACVPSCFVCVYAWGEGASDEAPSAVGGEVGYAKRCPGPTRGTSWVRAASWPLDPPTATPWRVSRLALCAS